MPRTPGRRAAPALPFRAAPLLLLAGCATVGSIMSPYPEKFGCKNSDHGVCAHPDQAYADAVAGRPSVSDPAVTNDKRLLRKEGRPGPGGERNGKARQAAATATTAFQSYRASVYAKLQGLIEQPVTPMLRAPRTVRTLILPYTDKERPERLYMPRYVFTLLERPEWVVGDYLVAPVPPAEAAPILGEVKSKLLDAAEPHP